MLINSHTHRLQHEKSLVNDMETKVSIRSAHRAHGAQDLSLSLYFLSLSLSLSLYGDLRL